MTFDRRVHAVRLVDHLPGHKVQEMNSWAFEGEELDQPVKSPPQLAVPAQDLRLKLGHINDGLNLVDDEVLTSVPSSGTTTPKQLVDGSVSRLRMPSLGSSLHATGQCKPCSWFWKPQGCGNAFECTHCHLCPEGEVKIRKKATSTAKRLQALHRASQELFDQGAEKGTVDEHVSQAQEARREPLESQQGAALGVVLCRLWPQPPTEPPALLLSMYPSPSQSSCTEVDGLPLCRFEPRTIADVVNIQCESCGDVLCTCPQDVIGYRCNVLDHQQQVMRPSDVQSQELCRADIHSLPSVGSANHFAGTCSPCAWFYKPQGCDHGKRCGRCHLCPAGEMKARRRKIILDRRKELAESVKADT